MVILWKVTENVKWKEKNVLFTHIKSYKVIKSPGQSMFNLIIIYTQHIPLNSSALDAIS